jgi:hypothetical protein
LIRIGKMNAHAARIRESMPQRTGSPAVNLCSGKKQRGLPPQAADVSSLRCAVVCAASSQSDALLASALALEAAAAREFALVHPKSASLSRASRSQTSPRLLLRQSRAHRSNLISFPGEHDVSTSPGQVASSGSLRRRRAWCLMTDDA